LWRYCRFFDAVKVAVCSITCTRLGVSPRNCRMSLSPFTPLLSVAAGRDDDEGLKPRRRAERGRRVPSPRTSLTGRVARHHLGGKQLDRAHPPRRLKFHWKYIGDDEIRGQIRWTQSDPARRISWHFATKFHRDQSNSVAQPRNSAKGDCCGSGGEFRCLRGNGDQSRMPKVHVRLVPATSLLGMRGCPPHGGRRSVY